MTAFVWAILATLIWGGVPIIEKMGLANARPMAGIFYRSLGVFVGMIFVALFWVKPQEIRSTDVRSALLLMTGGFLASVLAQICFYHALKLGEVSRLVPVAGSYSLITFVLGVLLLGETANPAKIFGAALIVSGVWLLKIG